MQGKKTTVRRFTQQELDQNQREITRILERGTPAEVAKLKEVERSPDLAPEIKALIRQCRIDIAAQDHGNNGGSSLGESLSPDLRYIGPNPQIITSEDLAPENQYSV